MRAPASTLAILALTAGALAGCGKSGEQTTAPPDPGLSAPVASPIAEDKNFSTPAPNTCKLRQSNGQFLPDPQCTPGAIDPAVTPANLTDTICKPGWREKAYPEAQVDSRMKADSALSYGLSPDFDGEYDHLISRMLGGSSVDPRNRWPQPAAKPNRKDRIEIALHEGVCKGMVSLVTAQRALATDWITAADEVGLQLIGDPNKPVEQSKACLRDNPSRCTTLHKAYDD
jgi:hypothetical protein